MSEFTKRYYANYDSIYIDPYSLKISRDVGSLVGRGNVA